MAESEDRREYGREMARNGLEANGRREEVRKERVLRRRVVNESEIEVKEGCLKVLRLLIILESVRRKR